MFLKQTYPKLKKNKNKNFDTGPKKKEKRKKKKALSYYDTTFQLYLSRKMFV